MINLREESLVFQQPARKYIVTTAELTFNTSDKKQLDTDNETRGIYFVVNAGGGSDQDITRYNAFFVESDTLSIEEQHSVLDAGCYLSALPLVGAWVSPLHPVLQQLAR